MSALSINDRLTAVLGSAATVAGMYSVLYYASNRLAGKLRTPAESSNESDTASAPAVPIIFLTPWIKIPLRVPIVLSGSFVASILAKAISYPNTVPISSYFKTDSNLIYAAGIALFTASAYLHYTSVKYMTHIRTPIEHGYQVKTACTKGPFAYFKHPTYVAMIGCSLSTALALDSAWCLASPVFLFLYLFGVLGPREEKYMKDYFGRDYIEYTKRVWF